MTSSTSSSASSHKGIIGSLISKGKEALTWLNSLGIGAYPKDQESLENDLTYDRQTKDVRSRISRTVWDRLATESITRYNSGEGYKKPLDLYHGL